MAKPSGPTTAQEQQNAFITDLDLLIERYSDEFTLTYASVIGCLEVVKADLIREMFHPEGEEEEEE